MDSRLTRGGSVAIEVFLALALLALNGILIAYVFSRFGDPPPWYAWAAVASILPLEAIALAAFTMAIDQRARKQHRELGKS